MSAKYCCALTNRLQAVKAYNAGVPAAQRLNGIDYLEVASSDQRTLHVVCILPTTALTKEHCRIDGGVRITGITLDQPLLTSGPLDSGANPLGLLIHVSSAGDFSDYTLRFVDPSAPDQPDPSFDARLAQAQFNFKAGCPSLFDCAATADCAAPVLPEPPINYLAKDYATFRGLMLDRLGVLMPDFQETHPADLQVALVEVLAYAADHLSYYQDAVATEAYLGTARSRISVRRHARLLDYALHDGCNARVWLALSVAATAAGPTFNLPARTPVLTRGEANQSTVDPDNLGSLLDADTQVFETLYDLAATPARNTLRFYTWSDENCWLAQGATAATLVNAPDAQGNTPDLQPGAVLIFEEVLSPTTGLPQDADPMHRQAVRLTAVTPGTDPVTGTPILEIAWASDDALAFALCVSAQIGNQLTVTPDISVARGNIVLADHGLTRKDRTLIPPVAGDPPYWPLLPETGIAFAEPLDPATLQSPLTPAVALLTQDPRAALPANMRLDQTGGIAWTPLRDLLGADRFATNFVLEAESDGTARVRFGDGINGAAPAAGEELIATYRLGGGRRGNVGPESLTRLAIKLPTGIQPITAVRNPLAAVGGMDPETIQQARQYAPQAFRTQERAVTATDYANVATQVPGVLRAVADFRWTGSWYTVYVTVDRQGGGSVINDPVFLATLLTRLDQVRLAGYDLEVRDPIYAPLDIALQICVTPDRYAADVQLAVLNALGTGRYAGQPAFFNPDNFSFGDPLYLSELVKAALAVPGVASCKVETFQRWGRTANGELDAEMIVPEELEVLRLANDPNFPENGRLTLDMRGGQ